ncbi:MAG: nucleotidyltransferase domain-containing protein [Bacillota bacterium]
MEHDIIKSVKELEEKEKIKILFACESGSRAWGTISASSDYDVRFIYIRKINWYLEIYEGRDVIEAIPNDKVEIVGWDLKKVLRLLQKSNPTLLEWINSPIIYICDEAFTTQLKRLSKVAFSSTSTIYHYVNMAKKNYQALRKETKFTTKRYLNILRPLLACLWILEKEEMPPYEITSLVDKYVDDQKLLKQFEGLVQAKKEDQQYFESQQLNSYIEETIPYIEERVKNVQVKKNIHLTDTLNQFFIEFVIKTNR